MKILNYTVSRIDVIFWIICGVAASAFFLFISLAATNTNYDSSNIINACVNISSFFLAAIFAIYTILITCDKKIPGQFLYTILFPVIAIITGLFALICSQFAPTEKIVMPLIGISLLFTITTLAFLFSLIEILIRLNNRPKLNNQSSSINQPESTKNE